MLCVLPICPANICVCASVCARPYGNKCRGEICRRSVAVEEESLRGTSCECANCGALALSSVRVFVASVAALNGVERLLMVEHCAAGRWALRGARPNPDAYKVLTLCPPLVAGSCVVLPATTSLPRHHKLAPYTLAYTGIAAQLSYRLL
jgi:hypothetical protein